MKYCALCILCLMATLTLGAIDKQYVYTQISQAEGLTSTVNSIYKEKDGAVWIGTINGLYSFNGYSLNSYGNFLEDSRQVFHIETDSDGNLWVLTDKHVFRRNYGSEDFHKVSHVKGNFYCMESDEEGIWIGGNGGIYKYDKTDDSIDVFFQTPDGFNCHSINLLNKKHTSVLFT